MAEDGYLLTDGSDATARRLAALAALFDPVTCRHLEAVGVGPGWRCWEVGAGGPSVPRWLADRVAPGGRVLATDLSLAHLPAGAGVEVRRHDVAAEPAPDGPFDLVHARLVLVHVPERHAALRSMAGALAPGGWLVVEDADPGLQPLSSIDPQGPDDELANRIRAGLRTLLGDRSADLAYGRRLPRLLRRAGLVDVQADAYLSVVHPAAAALETATMELVGERLVSAGVVTAAELERHLASVAAGRLDLSQPPLVSAWGRRPG